MNVRFMRKEDRTAVRYILKTAFTHGDHNLGDCLWLVAEHNGQIVGACSLTIQQKMTYLSDLGTLSAYRQQGVGTKLVEFALKVSKENTKELWAICTNPFSIKIVERLGFQKKEFIYTKVL